MYGFKPYSQFDKTAIKDRLALYTALATAIWDRSKLKDLAGGWDDDFEIKVQSGNGKRFTVEYGGGRSWEDAEKYGFVSAGGTGTLLGNINKGDFVFCHIKDVGFVGVGVCVSAIAPAADFKVTVDGAEKNIMDCDWDDAAAKAAIDPANEYFLAVKWIRTVSKDFGYWERGMTSVPMVAYQINDTTKDMVLKNFSITLT